MSFTGGPGSWVDLSSPSDSLHPLAVDSEACKKSWATMYARDLIDSRIISVEGDTAVEEACNILLSEDINCVAIKASNATTAYIGLFDFSDVNAFLTLAATRRTAGESLDDLQAEEIIAAARIGQVPVRLVSNFSQKNPLKVLSNDATVLSLLGLFSTGVHRALVSSPSSEGFVGMVSDRGLLAWFAEYAKQAPALRHFISNSLYLMSLPSLKIYADVVAAKASATVLDAMRLMSEEGVSSIAVLDDESGCLLSAISVTDIGKIVVSSERKEILYIPLHQFVSCIKFPDGSTDGVDRYPVYSVSPSTSLTYAIEKLLATNAHRLFVTEESRHSSPVPSSHSLRKLSGIVSIVDLLSVFARLANIADIDPTRMQRHRRASSASSQSSKLERDVPGSVSSSGSGLLRSSSFVLPPALLNPGSNSNHQPRSPKAFSGLDSSPRLRIL